MRRWIKIKKVLGYDIEETIRDGFSGIRKYFTEEERKRFRKILNIMWIFWILFVIGLFVNFYVGLIGFIGIISTGLMLQNIRRNVKKRL